MHEMKNNWNSAYKKSARVVGDVRYECLEMHQGAAIDGELRPIGTEEKPVLQLASSKRG